MASIRKRVGVKRTSFEFTVSNMVNGKSKPIKKGGFRTEREAKAAAIEMEAQLAKGISPITKNVPFDEYFQEWIEDYKKHLVSSTTLKHYEYSLNAIREHFSKTPIQNINKREYQKFINWFGSNKAKETVEKVHRHIRACVKDAIDEQDIHIDFTRNARLLWKVPKRERNYLDYEESQRLLKSVWSNIDDGLGYSLIHLIATSGIRYQEAVGLTRKDFNFENNTIAINKTWGYKKSSPDGFGKTKNEQSKRTIKMDNVTMNHFKRLFKTTPTNIHGLVFFSPESKYKVISNTTPISC